MKFALIALVASTAATKIKEEGMPGSMSTTTGSVSTPSKSTNKSFFCDPTSQTDTDWVFDYYDTKQTGSLRIDQVRAAIGNANDYLSQVLINKMEIDHVDYLPNGLLCDGLSPDRGNYPHQYTGVADDAAACKARSQGRGKKVFIYRPSDKACWDMNIYPGNC